MIQFPLGKIFPCLQEKIPSLQHLEVFISSRCKTLLLDPGKHLSWSLQVAGVIQVAYLAFILICEVMVDFPLFRLMDRD